MKAVCIAGKLVLLLLAVTLGCKSFQQLTRGKASGDDQSASQKVLPSDDRILFLGFRIELDTLSGTHTIALADTMIRKGKLKQVDQPQIRPDQSNFRCILYDTRDTAVYHLITENPLIQNLEYPQEDGSLGRATFYHREGYLMLRVPYNREYHHISFEKIIDQSRSERIGTVILNFSP